MLTLVWPMVDMIKTFMIQLSNVGIKNYASYTHSPKNLPAYEEDSFKNDSKTHSHVKLQHNGYDIHTPVIFTQLMDHTLHHNNQLMM